MTLDCNSLRQSIANAIKVLGPTAQIPGTPAYATALDLQNALEFCLSAPLKMSYLAGSKTRAVCDGGTVACWGNFAMQGEALQ